MANFNNFNIEKDKLLAAAVKGMETAATDFEADTKSLTHVLSGDLRRSWTHEVTQDGDVVVGAVGSNLEYAKYEDAYHGNISTAINQNHSSYMQTIKDTIIQEIGG